MLARVNSVQAGAAQLDGLVRFSREQVPAARQAPGFRGFYLLADRASGQVVSISLWDSAGDLERFEDEGARLREGARSQAGISSPPADVYEVLLQA